MSVGTTIEHDTCPQHGEKVWVDCWQCGGEGGHHDCMDDCCVCANPEVNTRCDICNGNGGHYICGTCHPESVDDL